MSKSAFQIVIIVAVILYIVSPIDLAPGPLDDVVVAVLGMAAELGMSRRSL